MTEIKDRGVESAEEDHNTGRSRQILLLHSPQNKWMVATAGKVSKRMLMFLKQHFDFECC